MEEVHFFLTTLKSYDRRKWSNFTGEILFEDKNILSYRKDDIKKEKIGIVFQNQHLFLFQYI